MERPGAWGRLWKPRAVVLRRARSWVRVGEEPVVVHFVVHTMNVSVGGVAETVC